MAIFCWHFITRDAPYFSIFYDASFGEWRNARSTKTLLNQLPLFVHIMYFTLNLISNLPGFNHSKSNDMIDSTWGGEAERRGAVPEDSVAVDNASALNLEALGACEADHGAAEVRHLLWMGLTLNQFICKSDRNFSWLEVSFINEGVLLTFRCILEAEFWFLALHK